MLNMDIQSRVQSLSSLSALKEEPLKGWVHHHHQHHLLGAEQSL
jgi:hypothetical protein